MLGIRAGVKIRKIAGLFLVCLLCLIGTLDAASAAYISQPYTSFVYTSTTAKFASRAFGRGGFAFIAGGVVLDGQARFYIRDPSGTRAVPPNDVALQISSNGGLYLNYRNALFRLESARSIACPLGRFVERGGLVAYTLPPEVPDNYEAEQARRLRESGLIMKDPAAVAREFADTSIEVLVEEADFADTTNLPADVEANLRAAINAAVGGENRSENAEVSGSYVNTDSQIVYQVYLISEAGRVDIAGVPLRYSWDHAADGSAIVSHIEAFSEDWSKSASMLGREPQYKQYDYILFYQTAGIFKQMFRSAPAQFRSFVERACAG